MTLSKKSDCFPVINGVFLNVVVDCNILNIDQDQNFK